MIPQDFKRILISFADNTKDISLDRNEILIQVRDELLAINIHQEGPDLFITENKIKFSALNWITTRLAKLPQLADRIIEFIKPEEFFIAPMGSLVDDLRNDPEEKEESISNISTKLFKLIDSKEPFASKVVYITSDAGEGKSTIINQLAIEQAKKYKNKDTNWLLLPVQLAGGPFMRLDDLIIASLVNRYRFPNFYFDSLLELIKEGVIVLALDGFEEMFMQSDEGEAISSLGQIMNKLDSRGTVMIAARKAYFDYKNLSIQARLFDSLKVNTIYFSRIKICRWGNSQFIQYAQKRGFTEVDILYQTLIKLLKEDSPLLTRAVLVKQLLEIFKTNDEIIKLSTSLSTVEFESHFSKFVDSIIQREANTKWINRSIDPAQALISPDDHIELLSILSQEMWIDNRDILNLDLLEFLVEFFSTQKKYTNDIFRQVKERIKQHALIMNSQLVPNSFSFDHDEFKNYFLGIAIANKLSKPLSFEDELLIKMLRSSSLPYRSIISIIVRLKELRVDFAILSNTFKEFSKNESQMSFLLENFSVILIKYLSAIQLDNVNLNNLHLPIDSMEYVTLKNIDINESYFQNTSFDNSNISNCSFKKCTFDRIQIAKSKNFSNNQFIDCTINCLYDEEEEHSYFDPYKIKYKLNSFGFKIIDNDIELKNEEVNISIDDNILFIEKLIRAYTRSTYLSESVLKVKFGKKFSLFELNVLPILLKNDTLEKWNRDGFGYRLKKPMSMLTIALEDSNGDFNEFLRLID
ncbi:MAG: hypothetical protein IAE93_09090 [Ignavibacteria bacterium]|nr:hypothetical protein [Ignavibacteria bacterium]